MSLTIIPERFAVGHRLFLDWMQERSGGVSFTSFQHKFLVDDEIAYKWYVYHEATNVLDLGKGPKWKPGSGRIIEATKAACSPTISANLHILEERFGTESAKGPVQYAEFRFLDLLDRFSFKLQKTGGK